MNIISEGKEDRDREEEKKEGEERKTVIGECGRERKREECKGEKGKIRERGRGGVKRKGG